VTLLLAIGLLALGAWILGGGRGPGWVVPIALAVLALLATGVYFWDRRQRLQRVRTLEQLQSMAPEEFEAFVAQVMERYGWRATLVGGTGDAGIDILLESGGNHAICQCKRYKGTVSSRVVRELYGVLVHTGADHAYLATSGAVSQAGRDWAMGKPITFIEGQELVAMMRTGSVPESMKPLNP
jgi:restriction system protein